MIVVCNQDYIKKWAAERLYNIDFGQSSAIGIMKNQELIGAVIYNNYRVSPIGEPISVEINVVATDKSATTRQNLKAIFSYPFIQLGVKRVSATVAKRNKYARDLLHRLGFKYEGVNRKAWHFGEDCAVYSLLKHECRYLKCH